MMRYCRFDCGDLPVDVRLSVFQPESGALEIHLTAACTAFADIYEQLEVLAQAYEQALASVGADLSSAVFRRLFCSDLNNQANPLEVSPLLQDTCAVSCVGQAPVGPAKVALWAYHLCDPAGPLKTSRNGTTFALERGTLTHYWTTGLTDSKAPDSYTQSEHLLRAYTRELESRGLSLAEHLMRTWFFVHDVDTNYQGLVDARRELFDSQGLVARTHYTASTGIGGELAKNGALVLMDAWAISGIKPDQIRYLKALDRLSPTDAYGVTFERGTAISYRDRTHVLISGTASIDNRGRIIYPGNVEMQLERTLENVEALLAEAGATSGDMSHWIVYLRDDSDDSLVRKHMRRRFGDAPMVFVHAPVCRPGWLVEVEGMAVVRSDNAGLPPF